MPSGAGVLNRTIPRFPTVSVTCVGRTNAVCPLPGIVMSWVPRRLPLSSQIVAVMLAEDADRFAKGHSHHEASRVVVSKRKSLTGIGSEAERCPLKVNRSVGFDGRSQSRPMALCSSRQPIQQLWMPTAYRFQRATYHWGLSSDLTSIR